MGCQIRQLFGLQPPPFDSVALAQPQDELRSPVEKFLQHNQVSQHEVLLKWRLQLHPSADIDEPLNQSIRLTLQELHDLRQSIDTQAAEVVKEMAEFF